MSVASALECFGGGGEGSVGYCSTAEAVCSQKIKLGTGSEELVKKKQQTLDLNDSNLKILWQLTVVLLMISFNGLEGDTDFHAFLSTEES